MDKENNIERYTFEILKNFEKEKPSGIFTDNVMNVILSEQTELKKDEQFKTEPFLWIFISVFASILLFALFLSGKNTITANTINVSAFVKYLQIDYTLNFTAILSVLKTNILFKILPIAIIVLLLLERFLIVNIIDVFFDKK